MQIRAMRIRASRGMTVVPILCSKDYKSNINCGNTLPYKGNLSRKSSFTKVRQKKLLDIGPQILVMNLLNEKTLLAGSVLTTYSVNIM